MTLQEQIEKLQAEYLSGDATRDPYLMINDALNLLTKQSEMLKMAKETLEFYRCAKTYCGIGGNIELMPIKIDYGINAKQALATIEEMEK